MHWSGLLTQSLHTGSNAEKEGYNLAVKGLRLLGGDAMLWPEHTARICGGSNRFDHALSS